MFRAPVLGSVRTAPPNTAITPSYRALGSGITKEIGSNISADP